MSQLLYVITVCRYYASLPHNKYKCIILIGILPLTNYIRLFFYASFNLIHLETSYTYLTYCYTKMSS
ncbi:hypothetical protein C2G38_2106208 [Gigaspora rosea]|uniref:Uncharacterized protein n=1 Tax=Gigaspora rosea TaxID=44941 RepID=A0A397UNT0_9GLOM|nr:hypothetical protein C2G38_2106208 [Gigaspora rosea]